MYGLEPTGCKCCFYDVDLYMYYYICCRYLLVEVLIIHWERTQYLCRIYNFGCIHSGRSTGDCGTKTHLGNKKYPEILLEDTLKLEIFKVCAMPLFHSRAISLQGYTDKVCEVRSVPILVVKINLLCFEMLAKADCDLFFFNTQNWTFFIKPFKNPRSAIDTWLLNLSLHITST